MRRPRISPRIVEGLKIVTADWDLLVTVDPKTGDVADPLLSLNSDQRDSFRRAQKYVEKLSLWYTQGEVPHED